MPAAGASEGVRPASTISIASIPPATDDPQGRRRGADNFRRLNAFIKI
jgi:hypothetical protein